MRIAPSKVLTRRPSQEALLTESSTRDPYRDSIEMQDTTTKSPIETREDVDLSTSITNETSGARSATLQDAQQDAAQPHEPLRLYKRRFFGLFQLVLLNIIVSWDVSY
jgi:hypothetical protein